MNIWTTGRTLTTAEDGYSRPKWAWSMNAQTNYAKIGSKFQPCIEPGWLKLKAHKQQLKKLDTWKFTTEAHIQARMGSTLAHHKQLLKSSITAGITRARVFVKPYKAHKQQLKKARHSWRLATKAHIQARMGSNLHIINNSWKGSNTASI